MRTAATFHKVGDDAMATIMTPSTASSRHAHETFVLQKVQPALLGLMDGSVSTLAPLFAAAELAHASHYAFYIGTAASLGAGVSMGLAEALSDTGLVTGRGSPFMRGLITGLCTVVGGMLHTFPFLIPTVSTALHLAYAVVVLELIAIAYIRYHFMHSRLLTTIIQVVLGGAAVFAVGLILGYLGSSA